MPAAKPHPQLSAKKANIARTKIHHHKQHEHQHGEAQAKIPPNNVLNGPACWGLPGCRGRRAPNRCGTHTLTCQLKTTQAHIRKEGGEEGMREGGGGGGGW